MSSMLLRHPVKLRGVENYKEGWLARIQIRGTRCRFGMFSCQQEAARVYDRLSYKLHGVRAVTNGSIDEDTKAEIESSSLESMLAVIPAIDPHPLYQSESAWDPEGDEDDRSMSCDSETSADRIKAEGLDSADSADVILPELLVEAESVRRVSSEPWGSPRSHGSGRISRSESSCACCETRECTNAYKSSDPETCEWDRPSRRCHVASSNSGSLLGVAGSDSGSDEVDWSSGGAKRSGGGDCGGDGDGCSGMLVFTVRKKRRMRSRPQAYPGKATLCSNGSERFGLGALTTACEAERSGSEARNGSEARREADARNGSEAERPIQVKIEPSVAATTEDARNETENDTGLLLCSEELLARSRKAVGARAAAVDAAAAAAGTRTTSGRRGRGRGTDGNMSGSRRGAAGRSSSGRSRSAVTTVRVEYDPAYCWKLRAEPPFSARALAADFTSAAGSVAPCSSTAVEVAVALSSCTRFEPPRYTSSSTHNETVKPGGAVEIAVALSSAPPSHLGLLSLCSSSLSRNSKASSYRICGVAEEAAAEAAAEAAEKAVGMNSSSSSSCSAPEKIPALPFSWPLAVDVSSGDLFPSCSVPALPPMVQSSPATSPTTSPAPSPTHSGSQEQLSRAVTDGNEKLWMVSMGAQEGGVGAEGGDGKAESSVFVAAQWLVDMAAGRSAAVC